MKKVLIASIIVSLLLLTVLSNVVIANTQSVNKITKEENNDSGDWNFGFILCQVIFINPNSHQIIFGRGEIVKCLDLDTGEEIQGRTRLFGFHLFRFLPMGHNYEISVDTEHGHSELIIEDLGFFSRATLDIEFWS